MYDRRIHWRIDEPQIVNRPSSIVNFFDLRFSLPPCTSVCDDGSSEPDLLAIFSGTLAALPIEVADRPRVVVALPDPAEGALVADWLSANHFDPVHRWTPEAAAVEMQRRAFDLLIADATWAVGTALQTGGRARNPLAPVILIGESVDRRTMAVNGQTMYLARPIERAVLSCFVSMALIDDRPVRRSPRKTIQRFNALINGVPSSIVDVSVEGLRLEIPRDRRAALPPYFAVRVPIVGLAIVARRMWTMAPSKPAATIWCGAALSHNRASSEEAWRSFVDTVPIVGGGLQVNPGS